MTGEESTSQVVGDMSRFSEPPGVADPHVLEPGTAPTPFTAEEIRRGCPAGRTIRLLVELADGTSFVRVNRFLDPDELGASIERTRLTIDGEPVGPSEVSRSTWMQLQGHASFPSAQTAIAPETIGTPMGALECLRYTVVDGSTTEVFWFARSAPGMPVKVRTIEEGREVATVTMVADERA